MISILFNYGEQFACHILGDNLSVYKGLVKCSFGDVQLEFISADSPKIYLAEL